MQAARGTSLSDAEVNEPARPAGNRRARAILLFAGIAAAAYAVDLCTKLWAASRLQDGPDVHVVGNLLVLHLTRNAGAAFSTGTKYTVVLTCLAMAAVLVVLWLSRRVGSLLWAAALGLLLAGVAGNLTDRLFREPAPLRGHVVDFVMLPHWPVFNVADMCINVAAVLILVQAFRGVRISGAPTDERARKSA